MVKDIEITGQEWRGSDVSIGLGIALCAKARLLGMALPWLYLKGVSANTIPRLK